MSPAAPPKLAGHLIVFSLLILASGSVNAQTLSLNLDSGSGVKGSAISLNLNLNLSGGVAPGSLTWTLAYPPSDITSINISAGPVLTAVNKTLNCVPSVGSVTCMAFSMDSSTIASGVVAVVTATLASATSSSSDSIPIGNVMGAYTDGTVASATATGGTVTLLNPVPTVSSLSPSSATAGGSGVSLTVNGTGFTSGSVVNWNGSARATTYTSGTQLIAAITATDLAGGGTGQATVFNPTPGGGTSGSAAFSINNPVPTVSGLSPSSTTAGSAAFTLTVNGNGFINGSSVKWNGSARTTTYVSSTQLTAAITTADIIAAGTAQVTTFNPTPGGGTSGSAAFTISASNPVPTISTLSPSSITAGSVAFSLTVSGTGFINGSVVNWNGSARTTTYVNATQVTAAITSTDVANAGTAQVTVFNPTPGGGTSGSAAFTINAANPVPTISTLSPSSATAGSAAFTLTVNGKGFINCSVVKWNGSARTTTYVSSTRLTAAIATADIATAGTAQVTVFNPTPGGGTSGNAAFIINGPNPVPTISSLSPSSTTAGTGAFSLTVAGTAFISRSVVNWNGSARTTTYVNSKKVTAAITAADVANAGTAQVTVFNPAPGGGTSGAATFSILAGTCHPTGHKTCPSVTLSGTDPARGITTQGGLDIQSGGTIRDLSCKPRIITSGGQASCELRLDSVSAEKMQIEVTSSSGQVRVPASIATRPNQSRLTFQIAADSVARQQSATISAVAGGTAAQDTVQVNASSGPVMIVPTTHVGRVGKPLSFAVAAVSPDDLQVQLGSSGLPRGAAFESSTGRFDWIPSASQIGKHKLTFSATDSAGQSSSTEVTVNVGSGMTSLADSARLTCSPGALATLGGSALADLGSSLSDPFGKSVALGGTKVRINGEYVPVIVASESRVTFVCPTLAPDTPLEASVESGSGTSDTLRANMQAASPTIFSLDGSGQHQGVVSFVGENELAMARNFMVPAHPAQPGDEILIWGTGFGLLPDGVSAGTIKVRLGGVETQIASVGPVPSQAGVYVIRLRMPAEMTFGDAVGVQVQVTTPDGKRFDSNEVTIAVESADR
jgi:uncharacterized protein (TIGR03437 family)